MRFVCKVQLYALIILSITSCVRKENLSETPTLAYVSSTAFKDTAARDSSLIVRLKYTDGDGDIGLDETQIDGPFALTEKTYYNLIIRVFEIDSQGQEKQLIDPFGGTFDYFKDTVHFSQRLKSLTPEGNVKSIKGNFEVSLLYLRFLFAGLKPDKIYFTFQLYDRKLHTSEIVRTPVLDVTF